MNLLQKLKDENVINPPSFLPTNTMYMVYTGSVAYGASTDYSDVDVSGFCIPPKHIIFPFAKDNIFGFDSPDIFNSWQQHHVKYKDKEYDFNIYNIVQYFALCVENNPNMIDTLYVPQNCIMENSAVGDLVRQNRDHFLSKKCFHSFKGYAFAQKKKMFSGTDHETVTEIRKFEDDHDLDHSTSLSDIEAEMKKRKLL